MARRWRSFAASPLRRLYSALLLAATASAQQYPFLPITGPNAPKGASFMFQDSRGGLWLAGCETGAAGLTYFDGSRFFTPVRDFPNVLVTGMAEDSAGGILLASTAGVLRVYRGHWQRITGGYSTVGIAKIAPDVFLAVLRYTGPDSELVRIRRSAAVWRVDTLLKPVEQVRYQPDRAGRVLFGCGSGFCELQSSAIVNWRPGAPLTVTRHAADSGHAPSQVLVLRDRFDCVWIRSRAGASYQCPGDQAPRKLPASIASVGGPSLLELPNGDVAIPSFARLAVGRPGKFRILSAVNGYPSTGYALATGNASIWLSNVNGLFVFNSYLPMEFWNERDGLDGNTWSILHLAGKVFAIAGDSVDELDADRARWHSLIQLEHPLELMAGPDRTILVRTHSDGILQLSLTGSILRKSAPVVSSALARTAGNLYLSVGKTLQQIVFERGKLGLKPAEPGSRTLIYQTFQDKRELGNAPENFFAMDRRGWFWRGMTDGIYVTDPKLAEQGAWLHLNRADGLPALDTNQHSFFEDADGSVWFGADNAVIHLSPPSDFLHPAYAPRIFLSSFSLDRGEPQMHDVAEPIRYGATITINVGSLQIDRRSTLTLRYRLLPDQPAWTTGSSLDLALAKPAWGAHMIEVQARLGTGPWSDTVRRPFTVLKPFWLTWPVLLGVALAGGLAAGGHRSWHKRKAKRAQKAFPDLAGWRLNAVFPEAKRLYGTRLDQRFEVGELLAQGGFAWITDGWDRGQSGKRCAIKIFRRDLADESWLAKRFRQEVLALEQLDHPSVVRIYGSGVTPDGTPYLAMEFIQGNTLRELLEKGGLSRQTAAVYLRQIGQALDRIHAAGICHRDLKPENLMIRQSGEPAATIVLIDFSIAILKDPDQTMYGLSRAAGTLHYMAPEQAIGYAEPSTDIYSLAKILIEMLTGERLSTLLPDASMDLPQRVRRLLEQPRFSLTTDSITLISSALEFDPAKRPQIASGFADTIARDLERVRCEPATGVG